MPPPHVPTTSKSKRMHIELSTSHRGGSPQPPLLLCLMLSVSFVCIFHMSYLGHGGMTFINSGLPSAILTPHRPLHDHPRQRPRPLIPKQVLANLSDHMALARGFLIEGSQVCIKTLATHQPRAVRRCAYKDLIPSVPLESRFWTKIGQRSMIRPARAFPRSKDCIVYGMGIATNSRFEEKMSQFCHHVHAFDCTVETNSSVVVDKNFTFHQTCVGSETDIDNVKYYGHNQRELEFKSLGTIMDELGHKQIDLLKFDIEGSEWELFETQILSGNILPPRQLLFELHAQGANPDYVPADLVQDKNSTVVNKLFLELYDLGYRILDFKLHGGDPACGDFSLVLVDQ